MPDVIRDDAFLFLQLPRLRPGTTIPQGDKDFDMKLLERFFNFNNKAEKDGKEPGRNELCWCGSGKKYKRCHLEKDEKKARAQYEQRRRV
jgi:hypothetical protein